MYWNVSVAFKCVWTSSILFDAKRGPLKTSVSKKTARSDDISHVNLIVPVEEKLRESYFSIQSKNQIKEIKSIKEIESKLFLNFSSTGTVNPFAILLGVIRCWLK